MIVSLNLQCFWFSRTKNPWKHITDVSFKNCLNEVYVKAKFSSNYISHCVMEFNESIWSLTWFHNKKHNLWRNEPFNPGEKWKIYTHRKNISSNQLLCTFIGKTSFSRNFCQSSLQCAAVSISSSCIYISYIKTSLPFRKNFAKISWKQSVYLKNYLLIWRIFSSQREFLVFPHCACSGRMKKLSLK